MIAVIADDFTGAAEIGGIGIRHGLNVVIETDVVCYDDVDLLVIATDTRSLLAKEAAEVVRDITAKVLELKPTYIYKKIDSVLRGNVYAELTAQMEVMQLKKSVVVAANPIFKRIIKDGEYFIDDELLNHTHFAMDPDFPVTSASVVDIIGGGKIPVVSCIKPLDVLPKEGVLVGDVTDFDDLDNWCIQIDENTMPAGASGFFNSLLKNKGNFEKKIESEDIPSNTNALFVLGSSYPKDLDFEEQLKAKGIHLSHMPEEIYYNKNHDISWFDGWVAEIVEAITSYTRVVVAVPYRTSIEENIGERLKACFGQLILSVLGKIELNELLIEGGSTTSKILSTLGITKLMPVKEFELGIIRMKVDKYPNLFLTTKPGSYSWPEQVWSNTISEEKSI